MRPCVVLSEFAPFVGDIQDERPETDRAEAQFCVRNQHGGLRWWPEHMVSVWDTREEAEAQVRDLKDNMRACRRWL